MVAPRQTFQSFQKEHAADFEHFLTEQIESASGTELEVSMRYSLTAGGKRLRPFLLLALLEAYGVDLHSGYHVAAALELIHTYSLIHDDLPAMDDDTLRRGQPTNHLKFNEATAILAGDALLTLAFEVLGQAELPAPLVVKLTQMLARAAGHVGMVGGQQADLDGEQQALSLSEVESIHRRKTGALFEFAAVAGGLIANRSSAEQALLRRYAEKLGLAFQIRDDVLDVSSSEEDLGKDVGSDLTSDKSTYPKLLGQAGAVSYLNDQLQDALETVTELETLAGGKKLDLLKDVVEMLELGGAE